MFSRHAFLVVDANPRGAAYLVDLLKYFGYQADTAGCIQAALSHLEKYEYMGVIIDGAAGEAASRRIVEWLRGNRHAATVIVIGGCRPEPCGGVRQTEKIEYLSKPVSPIDLKKYLCSCLTVRPDPYLGPAHAADADPVGIGHN